MATSDFSGTAVFILKSQGETILHHDQIIYGDSRSIFHAPSACHV